MAVCNRFNTLNKISGNFMLFSQYVEDITKNYVEGDNWKIVPSNFIAMDIDYSLVNNLVRPNNEELNVAIPKYLQNYFENGCAYGRGLEGFDWNSEKSKNLFWNALYDGGFLHIKDGFTSEVKFWNNINMQAFNSHNGLGYSDLYCYIPSSSVQYKCQAIESYFNNREYIENTNSTLEGLTDSLDNYPYLYYYNDDFDFSFNSPEELPKIDIVPENKYYEINTIVVTYDILAKENDDWNIIHKNIPMGMYIAGMFDNDKLTNTVKKYVTTEYGVGTSYGLRICTRFSTSPQGTIMYENELNVDSENYASITQLMSSMSECIDSVIKMTASNIKNSQQYKELYAIFKNNRTNVPYIKNINGENFWFVNGKLLAPIGNINIEEDDCTIEYATDNEVNYELLYGDDTPDIPVIPDNPDCDCNIEYATDKEIKDILNYIEL